MESNGMYDSLHAPSVPVHPLDAGHASASTTKVSINHFLVLNNNIYKYLLEWC
jgi:hypothetical protein